MVDHAMVDLALVTQPPTSSESFPGFNTSIGDGMSSWHSTFEFLWIN